MANTQDTPFHQLMHEVLDNLELTGTPASDAGIYTIGVDKKIEIHIATPDEETVFFFSSVYDFGVDGLTMQKAKILLSHNAMQTKWAPAVWLSPENKAVVWTKKPITALNQTSFLDLFKDFMEAALEVHDQLTGKTAEPEEAVRQPARDHHLLGMKA